jgi:hypothetical protein
VGKKSRANPRWRIRGDADRLVKALARCGENAKQTRDRGCSLSGLELACFKILYEDLPFLSETEMSNAMLAKTFRSSDSTP